MPTQEEMEQISMLISQGHTQDCATHQIFMGCDCDCKKSDKGIDRSAVEWLEGENENRRNGLR